MSPTLFNTYVDAIIKEQRTRDLKEKYLDRHTNLRSFLYTDVLVLLIETDLQREIYILLMPTLLCGPQQKEMVEYKFSK